MNLQKKRLWIQHTRQREFFKIIHQLFFCYFSLSHFLCFLVIVPLHAHQLASIPLVLSFLPTALAMSHPLSFLWVLLLPVTHSRPDKLCNSNCALFFPSSLAPPRANSSHSTQPSITTPSSFFFFLKLISSFMPLPYTQSKHSLPLHVNYVSPPTFLFQNKPKMLQSPSVP